MNTDDRDVLIGVGLGALIVLLWSQRCGFLGLGNGQGASAAGAGGAGGHCACDGPAGRPAYCPDLSVGFGDFAQGNGPLQQGDSTPAVAMPSLASAYSRTGPFIAAGWTFETTRGYAALPSKSFGG